MLANHMMAQGSLQIDQMVVTFTMLETVVRWRRSPQRDSIYSFVSHELTRPGVLIDRSGPERGEETIQYWETGDIARLLHQFLDAFAGTCLERVSA
jgi:hypothetical protein